MSVPNVHETLTRVSSYVLAEYGHMILDTCNPKQQFEAIQKHFDSCSHAGKGMIFNGYIKMANKYKIPEFNNILLSIFDSYQDHWDPELQVRAVEYGRILRGEVDGEMQNHL